MICMHVLPHLQGCHSVVTGKVERRDADLQTSWTTGTLAMYLF